MKVTKQSVYLFELDEREAGLLQAIMQREARAGMRKDDVDLAHKLDIGIRDA